MFLYYLPSPNFELTPPGITTQMCVGQMPVGRATDCGSEHQTDTQGRASLNVWSEQCQGQRQRQHRTEHRQRTHIRSPDRNKNFWHRRESNPGRRVRRQGLYRLDHGDGLLCGSAFKFSLFLLRYPCNSYRILYFNTFFLVLCIFLFPFISSYSSFISS